MNRAEFLFTAGLGSAALASAATGRLIQPNMVPDGVPKVMRSGEGRRLNVIGDRMTLKLTGDDTGGQYVLIEQNNEPGVGIPWHVHDNEDEIFRVVEGQLEVQVADMKAVLEPGDMVFCPRGIPHTWTVVGDTNAIVDLSFFPAGLEKMFEELSELPEGPPDMEVVARICGSYGVHFV